MSTLTISIDAELQLISSTPMPPASPLAQRRDSILKHQNSVKTDKRVSIKSGSSKLQMTSNLEYISEKPSSLSSSASTLPSSGSTTLERRPSKTTGPRPASLVITKQDNKGSQFKLVRSSSVDYEDIESQVPTARSVNKIILAEHLPEDESAPLVFTVHK